MSPDEAVEIMLETSSRFVLRITNPLRPCRGRSREVLLPSEPRLIDARATSRPCRPTASPTSTTSRSRLRRRSIGSCTRSSGGSLS